MSEIDIMLNLCMVLANSALVYSVSLLGYKSAYDRQWLKWSEAIFDLDKCEYDPDPDKRQFTIVDGAKFNKEQIWSQIKATKAESDRVSSYYLHRLVTDKFQE